MTDDAIGGFEVVCRIVERFHVYIFYPPELTSLKTMKDTHERKVEIITYLMQLWCTQSHNIGGITPQYIFSCLSVLLLQEKKRSIMRYLPTETVVGRKRTMETILRQRISEHHCVNIADGRNSYFLPTWISYLFDIVFAAFCGMHRQTHQITPALDVFLICLLCDPPMLR